MTFRGLLLAAFAAAMLSGCANLSNLFSPKPDAALVPGRAASGAEATIERAEYRLDVEAPTELRTLLVNYLDLARFQSAPATEGITPAELERLMLATPAQARGLLETEGYFNATVTVDKLPASADAAQGAEGNAPLIRVHVDPGPRARVSAIAIDATGDLQAAARSGNAAAKAELASLSRLWPLQTGAEFRQPAWTDAKNTSIARLRADGYAAADWSRTHAQVDAPANSVSLEATVDSGPLYRLGAIRIEGLQRYDEASVRNLATFSAGTPYSEKLLLDFQERLQKLGLFEGASVVLDAAPATSAAAPVIVHVKELPLQQVTVGVGFSADTGARLTLDHYHRRVFGTAWVARNKFELGPDNQTWTGELTSHPLENLWRDLVGGSASRIKAADEIQTTWSARVGRTQDTQRIERLYYAEVTSSHVDSDTLQTQAQAVSGNYHWVFRKVDNVLLPTQGMTLAAQAALGYGDGRSTTSDAGTIDDRGPFARAYARVTWYERLPASWYGTFRLEAGQVFTAHPVAVPDTFLFRAGGEDSVRGYGYRTLGPIVDGAVASGRTLLTGSVEVARPISPKYPDYLYALFIDAGNAADKWTDIHPAYGYGVGVRWRSPVGPLRVDLAYGQQVHEVRVHFSVGVAF